MAHLVAYHCCAAGGAFGWHGELGERRGAALGKSAYHLRDHIARLLQHDDVSHAHVLAANLIDVVQRGTAHR